MENDSNEYLKSYFTAKPYKRNDKGTFGKCIKSIIKTKHQYKIHLYHAKFSHQLSFRNMNLRSGIQHTKLKNIKHSLWFREW